MQAFPVRLRSGVVYWTVLDDALGVVDEADAYLEQLRFGRDAAESTTRAYAGALALYLGWCARTGQPWASAERLGGFLTWLQHIPADPAGPVLVGPGVRPVRRERRVNFVLTVVREFLRYGVEVGSVPPQVLRRQLQERTHELAAARATNRELMAEVNRLPGRWPAPESSPRRPPRR